MKKGIIIGVAIIAIVAVAIIVFNENNEGVNKIDFLLDWKPVPAYAPFYVAKEKGFFKELGLDVNILPGKGAETSAKLIGEGKYIIGTNNALATVIAVANEIPVKSVMVIEKDPPTAIFSLKEKGISKPEDLIGKNLGVRYYDISHKEYLAMMKEQSLDAGKVNEIGVGWELQPILTGQIDAMYNYGYNMPVQLENIGKQINKIAVKDYGVDSYGSNIIANNKYIDENPEVLKKVLEGIEKGFDYSIKNPEEAIDIFVKYNPEYKKDVSLKMFKEFAKILNNQYGWKQSKEKWDYTMNLAFDQKMINKTVNSESFYINLAE